MLRANRRQEAAHQTPVILSAADPLNLVGIVSPGTRLSAYSNQAVAYQHGVPLEVGLVGELISRLQNLPRPHQGQ
jgi:ATP-dependent Lhr-like helicase